MKVLFTTPVLEHPPAGGPALRIENSIKALSKVSDLHIIARLPKHNIGGDDAELFYLRYCKQFIISPSVKWSENLFIRQLQKIRRRIMKADDADFILKY